MSVTLKTLTNYLNLKESIFAPSQKAGIPFQVPSDVQLLTFGPLRMNPSSHPKDTSCGYVVWSPNIDPLAGACNGPQSLAKEWIWVYNWVLANLMLGEPCDGWVLKYSSCCMLQKPEIRAGPMRYLARTQILLKKAHNKQVIVLHLPIGLQPFAKI